MTATNQANKPNQQKEEAIKAAGNKLSAIQNTASNIVNWFLVANIDDTEEFEKIAKLYVEDQVFMMFASLDILSKTDLAGNLEYVEKINHKIKELERAVLITDQNITQLTRLIESQGLEFQKKISAEVDAIKSKYNIQD